MNLVHMRVKSRLYLLLLGRLHHNLALFYRLAVQIVYVLRDKHALLIISQLAVFLEFHDSFMAGIQLLSFLNLIEVIMPLPHCHWVLIEKVTPTDMGWI